LAEVDVVLGFVPDNRFVIWQVDAARPAQRSGPDRGKDRTGYTADELRPVLRHKYNLSALEIEILVARAENRRSSLGEPRKAAW
jgi:hypothetical protein